MVAALTSLHSPVLTLLGLGSQSLDLRPGVTQLLKASVSFLRVPVQTGHLLAQHLVLLRQVHALFTQTRQLLQLHTIQCTTTRYRAHSLLTLAVVRRLLLELLDLSAGDIQRALRLVQLTFRLIMLQLQGAQLSVLALRLKRSLRPKVLALAFCHRSVVGLAGSQLFVRLRRGLCLLERRTQIADLSVLLLEDFQDLRVENK